MNRILSLIAITTLLLAAGACSGKKQPEQTAVRSKSALSVLRNMVSSYEKKDLPVFMADVANNYQDRKAFSASLAAIFSKNESIRLNIPYTKMIILVQENAQVKVTFNWDGEWMAAGATQKNGGRATLILEPGTFKLLSIEGKNPFVPQVSEIPGANTSSK